MSIGPIREWLPSPPTFLTIALSSLPGGAAAIAAAPGRIGELEGRSDADARKTRELERRPDDERRRTRPARARPGPSEGR